MAQRCDWALNAWGPCWLLSGKLELAQRTLSLNSYLSIKKAYPAFVFQHNSACWLALMGTGKLFFVM